MNFQFKNCFSYCGRILITFLHYKAIPSLINVKIDVYDKTKKKCIILSTTHNECTDVDENLHQYSMIMRYEENKKKIKNKRSSRVLMS